MAVRSRRPSRRRPRPSSSTPTTKKKRLKDKIEEGPIVSLGDAFLVNLSDPGGLNFVKVDVSVLVDNQTPLEAAAAEGAADETEA